MKTATVTRRDFLAGAAAASASFALGAEPRPFAFEKVKLGKTGIETSRLGFGTGVCSNMRSSGIVRKNGRDGAAKIVRAAYDLGVRFFDVADSYGSHGFVADALRGLPRASYCLSTKYWFLGGGIPKEDHKPVAESLDRFLKELNTDYVDVVELHCVTSANWPTELAPQMEALEKAKRAGKIRAHGCTFHAYAALAKATEVDWLDCAHVRINHRGRHMSTTPERQMEVIKKLHAQGKGVIAMKLLGQGSFSSEDIDKSLAYVRAANAVDVYNVGFLSLAEINDMVKRLG